MPKKTARISLLLVNLLLAAAVVALGGASFQRKVQTFQQNLGFEAERVAAGWQVTEVNRPDTGLHAGDVIMLINGSDAVTVDNLRQALLGGAQSELIVQRGEEEIEAVSFERPGLDIDIPYLILALIGALYLLIGLYTLIRSQEQHSGLFYLWCLLYALLFLLTPGQRLDVLDRTFYALEELARLLLPALTVHLFMVFPQQLRVGAWGRRVIPFFYLPAAVLLALQADLMLANGRFLFHGLSPGQMAEVIRTLQGFGLYHLVLYSLAAAALLGYRVLRWHDSQQRRQVLWIALGMGAGYLPFLAYLLLQELPVTLPAWHSEWLKSLAVLPLALVPVTFAWAILRHKLWDIEVIVRDTVAYTVTALLGIIGFSLVNLGIIRGLSEQLGVARNLVSFAAGALIAALVVPARQRISSTLERLQYRSTFGQRQNLSRLAEQLRFERDLGRLCSDLLERLEDALLLERVALYLNPKGVLVPARPAPELPAQLDQDALGPELWRSDVTGLSGVALPGDEGQARELFRAGYRYAFPLTVRGRRIGLALTGYKLDSKPLNSDDQELIRDLLNQAALAIENAQLLGELRLQLEQVGILQRFNEGIIQSSPAGIAVLDHGDVVVSANATFAELVGQPHEEVQGRALVEMLPVCPLPASGSGLMEASYCDLSGEEHYLQLSVADLEQELSEPTTGMRVLVVHDVSRRVAMEQALREKERLASLGMLAAGVAHEVNTPITGICSYAQMLLDETPPEDPRHRLLKKVEAQTFRASRIVNNLLTFARHQRDEYREVDLGKLLQETLELLRERISRRRIQVQWQAPARPTEVFGNDGELQQVFTNLILNAVDAMAPDINASGSLAFPAGELRLRISEGDELIRVAVEDTGPGIPTERLERIFQPFFTTKLNRGGTGLGLSISHEIVQRHGGSLEVDSTPGAGTRFTVSLPRHSPPSEKPRSSSS